jgi:hypothetical protein
MPQIEGNNLSYENEIAIEELAECGMSRIQH